MITFSLLGNHGRLGNQMFQYSLLKSVSKKNNFVFAIPKQNHQLFECFEIKSKVYDLEKNIDLIQRMNVYKESGFHYDENVFNIGDNINYVGNFQSEKYFSSIRDELLRDFTFKNNILKEADSLLNSFKKNQPLASLHVRRGDYVNLQNFHPLCEISYYENSIKELPSCDIVCFSDDIEWCEKNLSHISKNIYFSKNKDPYVDLCLMSMCDHNIIANSSYSWWAAWLNKNNEKIVISPKKWFGPNYSYHNIKDLIPENWRKI